MSEKRRLFRQIVVGSSQIHSAPIREGKTPSVSVKAKPQGFACEKDGERCQAKCNSFENRTLWGGKGTVLTVFSHRCFRPKSVMAARFFDTLIRSVLYNIDNIAMFAVDKNAD